MSSDIKNHGWIRILPEKARAYVLLGRFDRPIGIWLLLLPCFFGLALGAAKPLSAWPFYLLFAVGAFVMRPAGCVINDIWDRDIDKKVKRTQGRPLASGALQLREAAGFLLSLLLIGLFVLLQMNKPTIILGFLAVPLVIAYPLMKRVTWWPQAFLGLVFNFGALMGYSAVSGSVSLEAYLLYTSCIFWTLAYDTIYAHQDKDDDALIGVKSTALKFKNYPKTPIVIFFGLQSLCLAGVFFMMQDFKYSFFIVPILIHQIWQIQNWNPENSSSSLKMFKSNTGLGLLIWLALLLAQSV